MIETIPKLEHSKRVADKVQYLSNSYEVYMSALYHDYLENSYDDLYHLTPYSYELVIALTRNGDSVIDSLKNNLKNKPQYFIDDVVYIKLCDRYDNLKHKKLKKSYIQKSIELIHYLYSIHSNKPKIKDFILNVYKDVPIDFSI